MKLPILAGTTAKKLASFFFTPRRAASAFLVAALSFASFLPASSQAAESYLWRNVVTGGGGGFVPGIIFNPKEPNLIYARTDIGGAYRWEQSTKSWIPLMDWIGTPDWNLMGVVTFATDPVEPERLYVAAGTYTNIWTSQNGAILRSTNRGNTFDRVDLPFKLGGNMPGRNIGERLVVDPHKNSILYLGAPNGNGLWRSTDFGATWSKVTSFPNPGTYVQVAGDIYQGEITGIGWIAFDPNIGTAGTASPVIYVGVVDKPTSIYRSTDGGATWSALPGQPSNFFPHHATIASNGMMYVTFSDTQGPYDGGKGDVWKFNTATGVWTNISPIPSTSTDDYFGYGGLAVDQQHPNTLMVASMNSWWPDAIIFRSLDGGATWTRIWDWAGYPNRSLRYTQDISSVPWLDLGFIAIAPVPSPKLGWMIDAFAIDPFDSNRMMYGTGLTIYGTENLTAWDTGGKILITPMAKGVEETAVQDLVSPPAGAPLVSAQADVGGFKHTSLTSVPTNVFPVPNFVTSTSIDFAELSPNFMVRAGNSTKAANPNLNRILFSFDGGGNWFQGNSEPPGVTGGGFVAANSNATAVLWSPPGSVVSVSSSNGNSWTASLGIPAGARIAADRVNPAKFYGFSAGAVYFSTNTGVNFTRSTAIGFSDSAQIKATPGVEGDLWVAGSGVTGGLWHSTDSGATFTKLPAVQEANNIGLGKPAPGKTYPSLYSVAMVGGVRGIFRSDDVGATWIRINDDQHQFAVATGAITGDPRVYGRVYLASNGRGIIYGELNGTATPDFALTAAPSTVSVARGASVTATITVSSLSGFNGTVALSASGLPTGVTATFSPLSAAGTSTLTLTASAAAVVGPASITITGTSGALTHTASVNLTVAAPPVADFSLAAAPATLSIAQSTSGTSTITVTRLNGFTGAVTLTASGLPSGVTASFSPLSATGVSTLTLTASSTAVSGSAAITVTGTSGSLARTASISLSVTAPAVPDFGLTAAPSILSVVQGASASSNIAITARNGFVGAVALSASGLPTGVTASFGPVTSGTSVLTLTASSTAVLGAATVTVTGTSGTLSHTTSINLTVTQAAVADFSLGAAPAVVSIVQGATATSTVSLTRLNGFAGAVTLSASGLPAGVTASFSAFSATNVSTLTLNASSTATPGAAVVTITGASGTLSHSASINLTVTAPTTGGTGGVTVTPAVGSNSPWFNEQSITVSNTSPITAFSLTITLQLTPGLTAGGQYTTIGSPITQSRTTTATGIVYQYTLAAGQTLGAGNGKKFAAQSGGNGTLHPTTGDTYSATYTVAGTVYTQSGHF